jgi:hypothetical protein
MIEFTPTVRDASELAIWRAELDGSASYTRVYFWISGLCLLGLLTAAAVGSFTAALGVAWRLPAAIGLIAGLIVWMLVMAMAPHLPRDWSDRRASRLARRSFRLRGTVQVWVDAHGLNIREGGLHTHLARAAIERIEDTPGHVVVSARTGLQLEIPKRIGADAIDSLITTSADGIELRWTPPLEAATRAALPPPPNPGHQADLELVLTAADLEALAGNAERRRSRSAAERDFRLGAAARTFVIVGVLAMWLGQVLHQKGAAALAPSLLASAAAALLAWSLAGHIFATRTHETNARRALQEFANTSDQRRLWLESDGLGWSDAVVARKAEWASLVLDQGRDHYFIHTADASVGIVIPRRIGSASDSFVAALGQHLQRAADRVEA